MTSDKKNPTGTEKNSILDEVRRNRERREKSYRERALKLFPHICGRCGREFAGKRLRELTVHHKDSNHENNPPDGSNWELLCLYCHDNEHSRQEVAEAYDDTTPGGDAASSSMGHHPFADLEALLRKKGK